MSLLDAAASSGVRRVFIIVPSMAHFTYHCHEAVRSAQASGVVDTVEVAEHAALNDVKPMHVLCPKFTTLAPDAAKKEAAAHGVTHLQWLPTMLTSDPMALWFDWRHGTVVQYTAAWGCGLPAFRVLTVVREASRAVKNAMPTGNKLTKQGWNIFRPTGRSTALRAVQQL